jgi:hypothetical protein
MLTVSLVVNARLTLWGRTLTPTNRQVSRDVATLFNTLRGVNPLRDEGSQDFNDLAVALDKGYVVADADGTSITSSRDLIALLNVGAGDSGGGGGGGNGDALVDPTVYSCPPSVAVNDAVYISGPGQVDQADADVPGTFPCIGFVTAKPNATQAVITFQGKIDGFVGLVPGDTYYVSTTPGQITNLPPTDPGDAVQKVGWARDATNLVAQIDRDYTIL